MSIRLIPPPERDFPAGRLQQRKEQLMSQIEVRQPLQRSSGRRRWPLALAATAAVAVAAIAVTALLPLGESGGPEPAAAAVLLKAARAAATEPATAPPSPGQFVYTKSVGVGEDTTAPAGGQAFNVQVRTTEESWIGPDGSGRLNSVGGPIGFPTKADRAAWVADGKPNLNDGSYTFNNTFGPGGLSYVDLSKLPTDPAQLKPMIESRSIEGGPPGEAETFTIIGDLLRETYAPPALRSALYTVAAQLPGVQLIGDTHDQLGRPGTAVAYVSQGLSHQLIFDPQTSALLAERTVLVDPTQANIPLQSGTVLDWTSYLSSGVVDSTTATAAPTP